MEGLEIIEMRLREMQSSDDGDHILILAEADGRRRFPIFIGPYEMEALDRAVHGAASKRPLTHDLILAAIEEMGGKLERVVIDDLRQNTFFGKLDLRRPDGSRKLIDCRPSDAMVLAAWRSAPIFVAARVLDAIEQPEPEEE